MSRYWCVLATILFCDMPARAGFSGLTLIRTADVAGPAQVCVDYQLDGRFATGSRPETVLANTQYGMGNRAEVGIDFDLSDGGSTGAVFNGRLSLRPVETGLGVAVGSFDVDRSLSPGAHGVATLDLGRLRCHLGMRDSPEETEVLSGLDIPVNGRLHSWAEHISGDEGASAFSLSYQFDPRWGVSLTWQRRNERRADNTCSIHAGCAWPAG